MSEGWPPLAKGLISHAGEGYLGFHMPGHQQGRAAWPPWRDLLGEAVFAWTISRIRKGSSGQRRMRRHPCSGRRRHTCW